MNKFCPIAQLLQVYTIIIQSEFHINHLCDDSQEITVTVRIYCDSQIINFVLLLHGEYCETTPWSLFEQC